MKTLNRLFDEIRVRGTVYFAKELGNEWAVEVPAHAQLCRFHFVLSGESWITLPETGKRIQLACNDFAIIPHGRAHVMCDKPDRTPTAQEHIPGVQLAQPPLVSLPSDQTVMMCGYFRYAEVLPWLLSTRLPDLLVLRNTDDLAQDSETARSIARLAMAETRTGKPASSQILNRFMEILFLLALREWAGRETVPGGSLAAITGEQVNRALAAIHDDPANAWTVENLAQVAGQSRTVFAEMFRETVGLTPIEYLNNQRMDLARKLLAETELRMDEIASRTGYRDASAFGRAFSREVGMPPAEYRRAARE